MMFDAPIMFQTYIRSTELTVHQVIKYDKRVY